MVGRKMWLTHQFKIIMKLLVISLLTIMSMNVFAADLQSFGYSSLARDKTQLMLTFSETIKNPTMFSVDDPAQVVLDFVNVVNKLERKMQQINIGSIKSVSFVEAGERTRMIINLDQKVPYTIEQDDNVFMVTVDGVSQHRVSAVAKKQEIKDIDFRRGANGEARLMIHLDDIAVVDVRQERDMIVVNLMDIILPEKLRLRLDVLDFGTAVNEINSVQIGNNVQVTLSTAGKFEHVIYQAENILVVEVNAPFDTVQAEAHEADMATYHGKKLSFNFQNIEVRAVLKILADFTEMNLVTSDAVQGNLTLRLKNVPWDQALDIILKTQGLAIRQNGNVMLIAPVAEISAQEAQELAAQKQLVELEPLYSDVVEVNFAKAADLAVLLDRNGEDETETDVSSFLSSRGSVTVDDRTNSLLLRDTAEQLVQIRKLIDKLDIPIRQVLIESRVVIANNDFTKELGARFGASKLKDSRDDFSVAGVTSGSLNGAIQLLNGDNLDQTDRLNVDLPVLNPAGSIALALAKLPLGAILELELSAMQQEGRGEIISSPRVITSNQKEATIEQGTEIPYQEASSSGATSVSFKKAVLKLSVTPQITPDDRIIMDLEVNKDEVGVIFLGVPSIDTRNVKTQVLVDNGETVVLGGIYEQRKTNSSERVPFFSELPYVGFLFRTTKNEDVKRELLIFVTPKIIKESLKF